MTIFKRDFYLKKIIPFIDKPLIKVITGVRRSGKSVFLKQIIDELQTNKKTNSQIIYINKESLEFDFIKTYKDLHKYIKQHIEKNTRKIYLFIDEIQNIEQWEKAISSFFSEGFYDIYITGSNAKLLSSELASLLSGRYIELNICTLSFEEFLIFRNKKIEFNETEFYNYVKYGGFPLIHYLDDNEELIFQYLNSLYDTILLKDIIGRFNVRNIKMFENLAQYIFGNIGNIFSGRRISKYLKSQNLSVGLDTIQNYLSYLENAFLINKVKRYDLKGKKILDIYEKYYLSDIGLKNAMFGYKEDEIAGLLENIVFHKLKQNGYKVFIGKYDDYEIDFIAENNKTRIYFQVSYLINDKKTLEREMRALKQIPDNYPKYILSLDKFPATNNEGIIRMNLIDFLLEFE